MADKPSRGLVFYGDGLMRFVSPSHTHLHELASRGVCGFLSLPYPPPPPESEDERIVRELAQLLDAYDSYIQWRGKHVASLECHEKASVPTISERFMGLRAAIFTKNSSVSTFANYLGFTVLQFDKLINNQYPEPPVSELLKLLGFQGEKILETCEFDLVFVHVASGGKDNIQDDDISSNEVELINGLVGGLLRIVKVESEIASRLHFSLVMSYGALGEDEDTGLLTLIQQKERNPDLSVLFPRQSYTMKGANVVDNIRHHCPMLITQWQDAVTRRDMADVLSFKEFEEHGANLAIPAERFVHEVAFKLWKAPKYGA